MTWLKYKETWKKFLPMVSKDCPCENTGIIFSDDLKFGRECECVLKAKALYHYENSHIPDHLRKDGLEPQGGLLEKRKLVVQSNGLKLAKHGASLLKGHCKAGRSVRWIDLSVMLNILKDRESKPKETVILVHRADMYAKTDAFLQPAFDSFIMKHVYNGGYIILTVEDASSGYAAIFSEMYGVEFLC